MSASVVGPTTLPGLLERLVEAVTWKLEDDARVHLDEATIRVERESFVAGLFGEPGDGGVVQSEVEHGVHHSGHRDLRPGADRHEQRVRRVAEHSPHPLLEQLEVGGDLLGQPLWPSVSHVRAAGVGGDRESVRDGKIEHRRHLGEVRALAPKQRPKLSRGSVMGVVEVVSERH